jgi:hypothetical protein
VLGSIVIVVLLWLAFASCARSPVAMLPVATGVVAGIAAVSLGFGQVHGMTLGFGTTLIGEAVDYAIYYLIQARGGNGAAERWRQESWPTVRLGLFTSLIGFAALVFTGFPGLAQLGVFSIAGLVAAAATTRFVFPVLVPNGAPGAGFRRQLARFMSAAAGRLPEGTIRRRRVALASIVVLVVMPSPWRGELSSLSPVSASDLALDATLRADVGAADAGALVAVAGASEQAALEGAEAIGAASTGSSPAAQLQGYDSPARLLPSAATQARRLAALPDAATLAARLAEATADGALPAARLAPFVADVDAARAQAPFGRAALAGTPLAAALDALLLPGDATRPWRALVNLQPGDDGRLDVDRVRAAIADVPGVRVVAIKAELDAIYARFLREAEWQAALGAVAVALLLAAHLRSARRLAGSRCRSPRRPSPSSPHSRSPVRARHPPPRRPALTVAIGSNYALFFDHLKERGEADADTLASLLLANLTTVASFALLASSGIPVLQAVGIVVAPGALLCLVFSPRGSAATRGRGASAWENRAVTTPSDSVLPAAHTSDKAAPWPAYVTASSPGTRAPACSRSRRRRRGRGRWLRFAANHAALTAGGLWPRSRWLGSNWTRLPAHAAARREIAITIDDGPDPAVTPAVLDLLDAHGAKATFFCIGAEARAHPALCREIVRRGHSVQNHSDGHSHRFSLLGPKAMAREIAAAQASLADITGEAPRFFRAPPGCAIRSWRRCCSASTCSSSAGHGAASIPCARADRRAGASRAQPGGRRHPDRPRRQRGARR